MHAALFVVFASGTQRLPVHCHVRWRSVFRLQHGRAVSRFSSGKKSVNKATSSLMLHARRARVLPETRSTFRKKIAFKDDMHSHSRLPFWHHVCDEPAACRRPHISSRVNIARLIFHNCNARLAMHHGNYAAPRKIPRATFSGMQAGRLVYIRLHRV